MSIKLGIYDFFAYMIPGGIAISAFLFILVNHFGLVIDYAQLSAAYLLPLAIVAYIFGYVLDSFTGKVWLKFFRPKNFFEKVVNDFNARNPYIEVSPKDMDWSIIFAYIRKQSVGMADYIDTVNAQSKMLANSSFGAFLFSIIFLFDFFISKYQLNNLLLSAICLFIALPLANQSVKFRSWFYESIFQSYVAIIAEPKFLPVKLKPKAPAKKKTSP